jgi:ribosomal protein S3AE
MIASEYGFTFEEFLDHTPKQIHAFMQQIIVRQHNESATQNLITRAALVGQPIEFKEPIAVTKAQLDEKQKKAIEKHLKNRFKEKNQEFLQKCQN